MMSKKSDIREIDMKIEINTTILHKIWSLRVMIINQDKSLADLSALLRPKSETQLRDKV